MLIRNFRSYLLFANPIVLLLVLSCLLAGLEGCAPRPTLKVESPAQLTPQQRSATLLQRTNFWRAYQAKLRIRVESPRGKYRFQALAVTQLPDQLRLEATNLWGQIMGILILNQEKPSLWIPSEGVLYTADDAGSLIEYLFGISIPPEILGYTLVACVPQELISGDWQARYTDFQWRGYSVTTKKGWTYTWKFLPESPALKAIEIVDHSLRYNVLYDPAVEMNLRSTPGRIIYTSSSEGQMEISVDQVQQVSELQPSLFVPPFPNGTRRIHFERVK